MEKEKQDKFTEAQQEAMLEQLRINYNIPSEVQLSNRSVMIRPIAGAVADQMSGYLVRQVEVESLDSAELIAKQRPNVKLQCKAVSLAILNDPRWLIGFIKINLFHWVHWRFVYWSFNSGDISTVLSHIIEKLGLLFFFQNMQSTKALNMLKKKPTKQETEKMKADQKSSPAEPE